MVYQKHNLGRGTGRISEGRGSAFDSALLRVWRQNLQKSRVPLHYIKTHSVWVGQIGGGNAIVSLGKRILEDELKFGKPEYGSQKIEGLARDLDVSPADLWSCVQFARKHPEISNALENLSWYRITQDLLPSHIRVMKVCPMP